MIQAAGAVRSALPFQLAPSAVEGWAVQRAAARAQKESVECRHVA